MPEWFKNSTLERAFNMRSTITTEIMTFDELPDEKARDKARQWFREAGYGDTDWSDVIKEDAAQIGFELVSWETDAWNNVQNVEGRFITSAVTTSELIHENHGKETDTYKTAVWFDDAIDDLPELPNENSPTYPEVERRLCEAVDALEGDFLERLEADYKRMLQSELEYRDSNAYIDESILANEYTFTASGKRLG